MDTLSCEIKRFLSLYNKNTTDNNLEISIDITGKYIFDTNVSNKYWKNYEYNRGTYNTVFVKSLHTVFIH